MDKLKLGVIGSGKIFRNVHAPAWKSHKEVELIAVCDSNRMTGQHVAEEYGAARVYTDYRELLKADDIDILDICTPNDLHAEISIAALQAGKHVLCEKPDAITLEQVEEMCRAASASGKILMNMRNNRFRPATQYMKRYIENGRAGEIYAGRCGWIRRRGIPGKGGWFTTKELSGGGPLIDLGVHYIDLAVWLMGSPKPVAISGMTYSKFGDSMISDSVHSQFGEYVEEGNYDVEDLAIGFIRFDNGASLQIEFSWASNVEKETSFLELRGTSAGFNFTDGDLKIFTEIDDMLCDVIPKLPPDQAGHATQIHHFVECVQQRETPSVTPEQGIDMIRIINGIYESAQIGKEVLL